MNAPEHTYIYGHAWMNKPSIIVPWLRIPPLVLEDNVPTASSFASFIKSLSFLTRMLLAAGSVVSEPIYNEEATMAAARSHIIACKHTQLRQSWLNYFHEDLHRQKFNTVSTVSIRTPQILITVEQSLYILRCLTFYSDAQS